MIMQDMIHITRRIGERLVIGGNVVVEVVQVQGQRVRISISAPKEIRILREELVRDSKRADSDAGGSKQS